MLVGLLAVLLQQPIAVTHVRVIDGNGGPPIEDGTVVVAAGRIAAVGPAATTRVPAGAKVVPGAGRSILPGLTDTHIHLMGGWDGVTVDMLGYWRGLDAMLRAGVTTAADMGNSLPYIQQIRQEVDGGRIPGPRLFMAGAIIDGPNPVWPPISFATGADSLIPGFVDQLKAARVDYVKAYGGLSAAQIAKVANVARERGLRTVVDAWSRNGTLDIARTGVSAFAHLGTTPITDETVAYQKGNGVASITTLVVFETFTRRRLGDLSFLREPLLAAIFPKVYAKELTAFATRPLSASDSAAHRGGADRLRVAMANAKKLFDAGVLLAAGTDSPYPGDYYGEGVHRELELLVEAGLTPLQAIGVATRNPARFLASNPDWGTIEPGKRADLLIVRGDPTRRISATRDVAMVIQAGRILDLEALDRAIAGGPDFHPAGSTAK